MRIQLSDHFTVIKLLRFVFPSIVMMIFTSIYSVVDGFFVSNFVGKTPFAAVNLIMPVLMMLGGFGFMLGTGGSAIVGQTLGEKQPELANRYFSMMIYATILLGLAVTALGMAFIRPISAALGAEGELLEHCVLYGRILLCSVTAFMLQNVFQSFLITAEKPQLGLMVTVAAGCANIALDFLFVAVFRFGLTGAAVATAVSQMVGGLIPFFYFLRKNDSLLRLVQVRLESKTLLRACANGASELMTNISSSVVNMLYNFQLMRLAGENGIAAYGVIMYVNFIFAAVFIGYSIGTAPVISYHTGAGNREELKGLLRKSLSLIGCSGVVLTLLATAASGPLARIFVGYDQELMELTKHGFRLYAMAFLFSGFNIFGSSFFTALGNGGVSAAISFVRTLVFQIGAVLLLPVVLDIDGIWLSIVAAELLALLVTGFFLIRCRNRYHYF